jgi:hypothetical protein
VYLARNESSPRTANPLSYEVQIRRAAELDIAEAQVWYEKQETGLGGEFHSEVSEVIDRLTAVPLIYQIVHRDIRRALICRFPYLVWYRVIAETVIVLACTYAGRDPKRTGARLR